MKVFVVKQYRVYAKGIIIPKEFEFETLDFATKLRGPYKIDKPKMGYPYEVISSTFYVRDVEKITKPLDDLPEEIEITTS